MEQIGFTPGLSNPAHLGVPARGEERHRERGSAHFAEAETDPQWRLETEFDEDVPMG